MKVKRNKFTSKKLLNAAGLLLVALAGLITLQKITALAQTGDFVNNIKTVLRVTDQESGGEKVNYLSGETINMSSRIEVTSDGGIDAYPDAYLLIKIPKQNVSSRPIFISTSAVSSQANQDTDTHYVNRFNYSNLQAGTINSINFNYSMRNPETPEGFQSEAVHELYDQDGRLLSRQTKTINTTKIHPTAVFKANKSNGNPNMQFIATYTDNTNTELDRDSFAQMGRVTYKYSNYMFYNAAGNNNGNGRKMLESAKITSSIPEHMDISAESLAAGWIYDEHNRQATFSIDSKDYHDHKEYSLTLVFRRDTPETVFAENYRVVNNVKIEATFNDETTVSAQAAKSITVKPLLKTNDGNVKLSKVLHSVYGVDAVKKNVDSAQVDAYNINQNVRGTWRVDLEILNNGENKNVPVRSVFDNLPAPLGVEYVSIISTGVPLEKIDFGEVEVFGHKSNGDKVKLGNLSRRSTTVRPDSMYTEYSKIEFKFRDDYEFPAVIDGLDKYSLGFYVATAFKDRKAFAETINIGEAPTVVLNNATANIAEDQLSVDSKMYVYKEASEVINDIVASRRKPVLTVGDRIGFDRFYRSKTKTVNGKVTPDSLKDSKSILLFPKELEFGPGLTHRIQSGDAEYIYDYKNTGKSALIVNNNDKGDSFLINGYYPSNMFKISEFIPDGQHEIELITYWADDDPNYTGTAGLDDLDFNGDGLASVNIARSKTTINVVKPEQVGIKKFVRSLDSSFQAQAESLDPGQDIEYQLSVINTSDRPLNSSRILEVLPKIGDKKIVEGNNGVQADRGSTTGVRLTKSIQPQTGFTILYSTEEPGANQIESWSKNFVPETQISDWSQVRMIKIQQNPGHVVDPQKIVNFVLSGKISEDATDGSQAVNTAAVAISETGNLVESDPVIVKVKFPSEIRGIAFEDVNGNSIFDEGVDIPLEGYKAEIVRFQSYDQDHGRSTLTGQDGRYKFNFKDDGKNYAIRFTRKGEVLEVVPIRGNSRNHPDGSTITPFSQGLRSNNYTFRPGSRTANINIGVSRPRGSVIAKYQTQAGVQLKPDIEVKKYAPVNEPYSAAKDLEISDDQGLVYEFVKLAENSDAETGVVEEEVKNVIYQYQPKAGGSVTAEFVVEATGQKITLDTIVKQAGTQVGTPYSATKNNEIEVGGLVYVFDKLKPGSAQETGRVSANDQVVTYYYLPKAGGSVTAEFIDAKGNKLKPDAVVMPNSSQIGSSYTISPDNELASGGITYIYKELKSGSAAASGKVEAGSKLISFVYEEKKGSQVIATYTDDQGRAIAGSKIVSAADTPVGTPYSDNPPAEITDDQGRVFTYNGMTTDSALKDGTVGSTPQIIKYQYVPKLGGSVKAKFVDQNGKELAPEVEVKPHDTQIGTDYEVVSTPEIVKDDLVYEFDKLADQSAELKGKVGADPKEVVIQYKPKAGAKVILKLVDGEGKQISSTKILQPDGAQVGTPYEVKVEDKIEIDGKIYHIKSNQKIENGRVSTDEQVIEVVYLEEKKIAAPATGFAKKSNQTNILGLVFLAVSLLGFTVVVAKKL